MRVVVALGGNALQRRGEPMTVESQRANVALACQALAPVALEHELVICHGNGPQVGLLALQASAYGEVESYPFDVLGAQTEGMIGYLIEQELGNLLPFEKPLATILTMTEVDPDDPAFERPDQVRRPGLHRGRGARGWPRSRAGRSSPTATRWRRVVPSPLPLRIFEIRPIKWLLEPGLRRRLHRRRRHPDDVPRRAPRDARRGRGGHRQGPRPARCWRSDLDADPLVIATDTDAVYVDWGTPQQRAIAEAHPDALGRSSASRPGSMGPKVEAAATSPARARARWR